MSLHSEYLDYQKKLGDYKEANVAILRDEPDGQGTSKHYRNEEYDIKIMRTPKRIIIELTLIDDDDADDSVEILVIPVANILTIKVNSNTPTYRHYGEPFALVDFCREHIVKLME